MRYLALATDYDGTIARHGAVADETRASLARLRASGRRVILVTGRRLDDLRAVASPLTQFDAIVAENGGLLHWPETRETLPLGPPPPPELLEALRARGVAPLEVGQVIAATHHPHEQVVVALLHELALELQIIFNGDSVMILPPGVNKATGLRFALLGLGLTSHEVVGVGDAANDHSFLQECEAAVAVANAPPALAARVDLVTRSPNGEGVVELVNELVETDLARLTPGGLGSEVVLGLREDGTPATFRPFGHTLLIAGPSASGKSTFATGLIERLTERSYQLCVIDPEGDYGTLSDLVTLGNRLRVPHVDEVLAVLADPTASLILNLLGVPLAERPDYFVELLPHLQRMRARTGRPHWLVIDEVHHLLASGSLRPAALPERLGETIMITVHPAHVAAPVLRHVDVAIAVGVRPEATLAELAPALGVAAPTPPTLTPARSEVILWEPRTGAPPERLRVVPARAQRLRHLRKYAEGDLGSSSFWFRGPEQRLNLRAANLVTFCELGMGVDDETWLYHLGRRDYSRWIRDKIKDPDLAEEVAGIEEAALDARASRRLVRDAIDRRYTLPA